MAIYRTGKASMDASGKVTGTGTKWKSALTLIRAGATIMFMASDGLNLAVVAQVVSDTEIKAITTDGKAVASSDYAILLHDSITVDGLAQDVAETLRYYQGRESEIARFVDIVDDFDWDRLEQIRAEVKAAEDVTAANATASADSATASATAQAAAEKARDDTSELKDQAAQSVAEAQAAQAASELAQSGSESARDAAAASAAEAEDWAKQLNADELMRKDANLSDVADKSAALKNLQDGKPLTLIADAVGQYDAVTLKQLQAASGGGGGANMNGVMNNFIGAVSHFNGTRAKLAAGHVAGDGQLLNRAEWPDLWSAVNSGFLNSVDDATWLADPTKRGRYSKGNGTTTFRVPDYNGVVNGSYQGLYLGGDGVTGISAGDAVPNGAPNITGTFLVKQGESGAPSGALSSTPDSRLQNSSGIAGSSGVNLSIDASKSSPAYGRSEYVRPNTAVGVWIIRASGAFDAASTNFNVINSDATLPSNGTVARGGAVRSVYRSAGKDHASAELRVKDTIGGAVVPELSATNSTGQVTGWTMPAGGGELLTLGQLGTAATENKQTSTTDSSGLLINGAWGLGGGGVELGGWSNAARIQKSSFISSVTDSPVASNLFMGVNASHGSDPGFAAQFAARGTLGFYWRTREATNFNPWRRVYDDGNTTRASDGTLKAASPVARIVHSRAVCDRVDINEGDFEWCGAGTCNGEARGITISRTGVGIYVITGALGLAKEGWRLAPPRDPNGEGDLGVVVGQENESEGTITVLLYKKKYVLSDEGEIKVAKGDLIDVPAHSWIDVRLDMPKVEDSAPVFDE